MRSLKQRVKTERMNYNSPNAPLLHPTDLSSGLHLFHNKILSSCLMSPLSDLSSYQLSPHPISSDCTALVFFPTGPDHGWSPRPFVRFCLERSICRLLHGWRAHFRLSTSSAFLNLPQIAPSHLEPKTLFYFLSVCICLLPRDGKLFEGKDFVLFLSRA